MKTPQVSPAALACSDGDYILHENTPLTLVPPHVAIRAGGCHISLEGIQEVVTAAVCYNTIRVMV